MLKEISALLGLIKTKRDPQGVHGTVLSMEQSCMARRTDVLKAGREQVEERSAITRDVRIFLGKGPIMLCGPGEKTLKRGVPD